MDNSLVCLPIFLFDVKSSRLLGLSAVQPIKLRAIGRTLAFQLIDASCVSTYVAIVVFSVHIYNMYAIDNTSLAGRTDRPDGVDSGFP